MIFFGTGFNASSALEETSVGQLLCLADINLDVLGLRVLTDDHTGSKPSRPVLQRDAALLCVEQTIGDGLTALVSDQEPVLR